MRQRVVIPMAFTGGFSIMCFELLGGRLLAPYFGSSVYVWGSIITVFMLALSAGYLLGGRYSLFRPGIVRYSMLFIVSALCILPTIFFSDPIMNLVFTYIEDPRYGSLVASLLLFLLPTSIMGMIAPYSVRILTQSTHSSGHTAGYLYFISTIGSALGTILTSFYWVLWMEIDGILWSILGIMAGAGGVGILSTRFVREA